MPIRGDVSTVLQLSFVLGLLTGFVPTLNLLHILCLNAVNLTNLI